MTRCTKFAVIVSGALVVWPAISLSQADTKSAGSRAQRDMPSRVVADRSAYKLSYDHVGQQLTLYNEKNERLGSWDYRSVPDAELARATIPPDRPIRVVIENANALLYRYDVDVDTVRRMSVRTCRSLGGTFVQQAFLAGVASVRGVTFAGPSLDSLFRGPLTADQLAGRSGTRGESKGPLRLTPADWEAIRRPIADYIDYVDDLDQLGRSIDRALAAIAEQADAVPLDTLLRRLQDSIATTHPGITAPEKVPQVVFDRLAALQPQIVALTRVARTPTPGPNTASVTASSTDDAQGPYAADAAHLKVRLDSTLARLAPTYRRLETSLLEIRHARLQTRQAFTVSPSGDLRRLTINLRATDTYKDLPRLAAGAVELFVEPAVRVSCALSVGVAFMSQPPKYDVRDAVAANTVADETRTTAAVLLHLWSGWTGPLAAATGLGLGVNKSPDLYLGGTLKTFSPALVNFGAVWQRTSRLPADLAPPAHVTSAQLDHLPKAYRAGWFAGLSITR